MAFFTRDEWDAVGSGETWQLFLGALDKWVKAGLVIKRQSAIAVWDDEKRMHDDPGWQSDVRLFESKLKELLGRDLRTNLSFGVLTDQKWKITFVEDDHYEGYFNCYLSRGGIWDPEKESFHVYGDEDEPMEGTKVVLKW
jgi:hypothetical protein